MGGLWAPALGAEGGTGVERASADAAPGSIVLTAGDALYNIRRGAAIDGVGVGAAVFLAPLIRTPRHDRPAMVHGRITPNRWCARSAIFQGAIFGVSRDIALP